MLKPYLTLAMILDKISIIGVLITMKATTRYPDSPYDKETKDWIPGFAKELFTIVKIKKVWHTFVLQWYSLTCSFCLKGSIITNMFIYSISSYFWFFPKCQCTSLFIFSSSVRNWNVSGHVKRFLAVDEKESDTKPSWTWVGKKKMVRKRLGKERPEHNVNFKLVKWMGKDGRVAKKRWKKEHEARTSQTWISLHAYTVISFLCMLHLFSTTSKRL